MGCWDIFCFACGNTCHSLSAYNLEDLAQMYKQYIGSSGQISKSSKLSPYHKKLLEKINSDPEFFSKLKNLYKKSQWLNKCTFLTVDDRIIHGCEERMCNMEFYDKKSNKYYHDFYYTINELPIDKTNSGVFIHSDCWKYIKSQYKINLKYSDVPIIPDPKNFTKINPKINYGLVEKYWEQDFQFIDVIFDSNEYICESPLINKQNQIRIKKILTQLKLNTDPKRIGPAVSATFYPESTIKYGLDDGLWIKSGGKWIKLKEPIIKYTIEVNTSKLNSTKSNLIKKIVCIGEPSESPIFITNIKCVKSVCKISLIGTENLINKYEKVLSP